MAACADLLPDASLEPAPARAVRSRRGCSPRCRSGWSPARSLTSPSRGGRPPGSRSAIAWACLALAAVGGRAGAPRRLVLSERRGTFVSAVTHELRTPLTTFRLYTEMLDEGMVAGADSQRPYFKTLRAEADRLGHLVENVLSFARLERGRAARIAKSSRPPSCSSVWPPGSTSGPSRPAWSSSSARLTARLERARGPLRGRPDPLEPGRQRHQVRRPARPTAASTWTSRPGGRWLTLTVRDHGPGLPPRIDPPAVPPILEVRRRRRPSAARQSASASPSAGASPVPSAATCALENGPLGAASR